MSSSYQKVGPLKIEELGVSPEELVRKKKTRKFLFAGITVVLLLTLAVMAVVVMYHQQRIEEQTSSQDFGIASLASLNDRTDSSVSSGCETTILLLRHCEKSGAEIFDQDGNQHCSYVGYERAYFLKTLFGPGGWAIPSVLYALAPKRGKHFNFREVETLVPLAEQIGLQIHGDYKSNDELVNNFFKRVATGKMCGKIAVVSWKHEKIGDLARKLACPDCPLYFPDEFDKVWQLKYVYDVMGTGVILKNHVIQSAAGERQLRKKKHSPLMKNADGRSWSVYSSISNQGFDPLEFSSSKGDYDGGVAGGNWFAEDEGEM